MSRLIRALLAFLLTVTPAFAGAPVTVTGSDNIFPASATNPFPVVVGGGGVPLAQTTSTTAAVPNVSTTVTLVAASSNVTILVQPGAAALSVNFSGAAATTSNFTIPPGYSFTFQGAAVTTFKVIGASALGSYSVFAH